MWVHNTNHLEAKRKWMKLIERATTAKIKRKKNRQKYKSEKQRVHFRPQPNNYSTVHNRTKCHWLYFFWNMFGKCAKSTNIFKPQCLKVWCFDISDCSDTHTLTHMPNYQPSQRSKTETLCVIFGCNKFKTIKL